MRRRSRFQSDQAARKLGEKPPNMRTTQRPPDHNLTSVIHAVNLKNLLRQVQADRNRGRSPGGFGVG